MTNYRVSFFKSLSSCYGKRFEVCQRSIVIRSTHNRDRAIKAAKSEFERLERVGDWTLRADKIEVEAVSEEAVNGPASEDPVIRNPSPLSGMGLSRLSANQDRRHWGKVRAAVPARPGVQRSEGMG